MIDHEYRGQHDKQSTYTLYIHEYHGEYPPPDASKISKDAEHFEAKIEVAWHTYQVEELLGIGAAMHKDDKHLSNLLKRIGDKVNGGDDCIGIVYMMHGTLDQLTEIFTKWVHSVTSCSTGGDCDTFDYHPGALEALYAMAIDLDDITRSRKFTRHLAKAYKAQDERCALTSTYGSCVFMMPKKHPARQRWAKHGR